jgi:hypothetical protein
MGTAWSIEGDIAQCFDRFDHSVMFRSLSEKVYDNRFLRLVRNMLTVRYADDTLLGFAGPKAEAEEIKERLAQFLRGEIKLELSPEKTLITQA